MKFEKQGAFSGDLAPKMGIKEEKIERAFGEKVMNDWIMRKNDLNPLSFMDQIIGKTMKTKTRDFSIWVKIRYSLISSQK